VCSACVATMAQKLLSLGALVVGAASASSAATVPAFAWNLEAAQATHLGLTNGADVENIMSFAASKSQRELSIVFFADGLTTEAVKAHGGRLTALNGMLSARTSLTLPFTTAHHTRLFNNAERIRGADAEAYFKANPNLFTNGVADVVVVELEAKAGAAADEQLALHDAMLARIVRAVDAGTRGNYVGLLTAGPASRRQLKAVKAKAGYIHTSPTLLTAQLVMLILIVIFLSGFCCLFSLQTPKRFEEVKAA